MRNWIIIVLVVLFGIQLSAEWIDIAENRGAELFEHTSYGKELTEIHFSLPGYEIEQVVENGKTYQKITYRNEGEILEVGKPDLPCFTRLIAIPNEGNPVFELVSYEEEILSNIVIYPQQELQSESQSNRTGFTIDESFYAGGNVFPQEKIQIGNPAIMRGLRVVNLTINPFQYDPQNQELTVIKNIDVVVRVQDRGGENPVQRKMKLSRAFEPLYKATVLNYDSIVSREDNFQDPSYLFIHTDNHAIDDELAALTEWKHQKGFEVSTHSVNNGTSFSTIKSYIQDAYDNWENPPEFICLLGDASGNFNIATDYSNGGEGDQGYVRLDGTDILADALIGRLSFEQESELQTIVSKILNYEKVPYMGQTDWYTKAVLVGDPSASGTSCIDTKQHVKEIMLQYNQDFEFNEYYSGNYSSGMTTSINAGVSYLNYRGFAGMSGFDNSSINNLNNGYMLPIAVFPTCDTGTFASGWEPSRSEKFIRAGSPGQPKGAVAAYGTATLSTHTCFNNIVDAGTYYGIFSDHIFNMGGALNRGKVALYTNYPYLTGSYVTDFSYWNSLMGDPGMEIWTGIPQDLVVSHDTQIGLGSNIIAVNVKDSNNQPIEGAWVTALLGDDDIFATGYTDSNGDIILEIYAQDTGSASLTVTNHNFIPYLGSFDVGQADRFVNIFDYEIDDDNVGDSSGNDDGIINPGETIELKVSLKNFGTSTANDVAAEIDSNDDYITISDDTEDYGAIAAGTSAYSADDFDFSVDSNVLGGMEINLAFTIEDNNNTWIDYLSIPVEGASLVISDYSFPNNPNGIFEPGETTELTVTIENPGTVDASDIYGTLVLNENWFTISDDEGSFGNVTAAGQATNNSNTFEVTAVSQIIIGSQFVGEVRLYNASGYDNITTFTFTVGEASVTDPLGPDTYGYYCYDDGDTGYYNVPSYSWVEINNIGTDLNLSDQGQTGDTEDISDLPITFRFYGVEYNSLTVCSNGWIAPGQSGSTSFMNWQIPGPQGPNPMIAAFWDDLKTASGDVFYNYDSAQNYLVIEWDNMQNEHTNHEETFQVILYDSNYYPTSTGDSEIKFQYKVFNNTDVGAYPSNHGQYCTVGIEDHTGRRGLEYTFNDSYPTQAKQISNETAILFTGPPIESEEPYLVLGGLTLNDTNGNGQADYAETVNFDVLLNNIGNQPANNVSAVISSSDVNISITQNTSNYNAINGSSLGTNITAFAFDVAEDCPDGHIVPFVIDITSDEDNWQLNFTIELNAPLIVFNAIVVDDGDNNILDPGETADIYVSFENTGGAEAYNVEAVISESDQYITLNSATYSFNIVTSGSICTAEYNVTAETNAPIGHVADISWIFSGDYNYSSNGIFPIVISQIPVLMNEDFSGTFPPDGWSIGGENNWHQSMSNMSGGTAPEAQFMWGYNNRTIERLIGPTMNTVGNSSLDLTFQHAAEGWDMYTLKVQTTSDGSTWNDAWSITPNFIPPEEVSITIDTPDVGSANFQLAFVFDGELWSLWHWSIDNVHLEGGQIVQLGFIEGTVSISGGSGNVEDAVITAGEYVTSPNASGLYSIPIPEGTYDMTTELEGYETSTQENISVTANQTTIVDFDLIQTGSDDIIIPKETALLGNYPNPFNPSTTIKFALKENSQVNLEIYNVKGQKVKTLVNNKMDAGIHQVVWNGMDNKGKHVSSGIYFYRMKAGVNYTGTHKIIMLK
jgi:Peptidase family C25/Propeptide_C25/FlgD Ig-like domain/Carboxypeptidase regulatory-like domain